MNNRMTKQKRQMENKQQGGRLKHTVAIIILNVNVI